MTESKNSTEKLRITIYPSFSPREEIIFSERDTIYTQGEHRSVIERFEKLDRLVEYIDATEFVRIENLAQLDGDTYTVQTEKRVVRGLKGPDMYWSNRFENFLLTIFYFVRNRVQNARIPFNDYVYSEWIETSRLIFKPESRFNHVDGRHIENMKLAAVINGLEYDFDTMTRKLQEMITVENILKRYEEDEQDLIREILGDVERFEITCTKNRFDWLSEHPTENDF
jgi:hypothetical protein